MIDLTQTLRPSTPVIQLPPPFAPSDPFSISEISNYDERGPAWYWNNLKLGEHTGTHFDAPIHWVTGKDYSDGATDTIAVQRFVAPAVVIDCSKEAAADEKFVCEPSHIEAFEAKHGRIPDGAWVLMRTDWSKRTDPAAFLNMKEDGPHVPGPSAACVKFLVEERNVNGWGVEAVGTDAGQAFAFEPAFPAHHLMHGAEQVRPRQPDQSRPAAADRRGPDHHAAQDREGVRAARSGRWRWSRADPATHRSGERAGGPPALVPATEAGSGNSDQDLPALDLDLVGLEVDADRRALGLAGAVVEAAVVLGALDDLVEHQPVGQEGMLVGADAVGRVVLRRPATGRSRRPCPPWSKRITSSGSMSSVRAGRDPGSACRIRHGSFP